MNLPAVIVAGGRGSRLGAKAADVPKALVPVAGRPLLDYALAQLQKHGVGEVVICTGHLAARIEEYVNDGSRWGLRVRYSREDSPLGTAGCLRAISPPLEQDFFVIYADVLMELDLTDLGEAHRRMGGDATLVVQPNNHPHDSDLVEIDRATGMVRAIHRKPHPAGAWLPNLANAAAYVFKPKLLELIPPGEKADCAQDLFPRALAQGRRLFGYRTSEFVRDAGTPERLKEVERALLSGRVARSSRRRPRPAVFLDRDGVINREVKLLHDPRQLELLPGAAGAIRKLNGAGWLAIVVTNQPVVARGLCSEAELQTIHAKLETLLGAEGAYLNAIFYCPHHPDGGYAGENPAYKIPCRCRKPGLGMVEAAVAEFNLDLSRSFLIGDTTTDVQTGRAAGTKTVLVQTGYGGTDGKYAVTPDHTSVDLVAAVDWILARGCAADQAVRFKSSSSRSE